MILWLFEGVNRRRAGLLEEVVAGYLVRCRRYMELERKFFSSERQLMDFFENGRKRAPAVLILMDSGGKLVSSDEFAEVVRFYRDGGTQQLIVAIGPADGWSKEALAKADRVISLGKITLPHELAAVVTAEQLYRALTILAGHPYHIGHAG